MRCDVSVIEAAMGKESGMQRTMGLAGATGVGVGAIVGGGILALAGVAFSATGPGAMLAFALNGIIAMLTALSFAEMAAAFPESGGTYTFAKKVLNVRIAFAVGWVFVAPPIRPTAIGSSIEPTRSPFSFFSYLVKGL